MREQKARKEEELARIKVREVRRLTARHIPLPYPRAEVNFNLWPMYV